MKRRTDTARPWSPEEVELGMAAVAEEIEDALAMVKSLGEEAAHKRVQYEVEESKLMLMSVNQPELKTEALRKAWVTQQTGDLKLAMLIAANLFTSQVKQLAMLEVQSDLLRSAGRSHRDMVERPGYGTRRD